MHSCDVSPVRFFSKERPKCIIKLDKLTGRESNNIHFRQAVMTERNQNLTEMLLERSKNYNKHFTEYEFMDDFCEFKDEILKR